MNQQTFYPYESNGIGDFPKDEIPDGSARVLDWDDPQLCRVTRLRLVTDPGCPFWDVSYCWGLDTEGKPVRVRLPFGQLPRGKGKINGFLIEQAKKAEIHAKRLGILDSISCLW